jgi:hypothetical protein
MIRYESIKCLSASSTPFTNKACPDLSGKVFRLIGTGSAGDKTPNYVLHSPFFQGFVGKHFIHFKFSTKIAFYPAPKSIYRLLYFKYKVIPIKFLPTQIATDYIIKSM